MLCFMNSDKTKESRYCVETVPTHGCVSIVCAEAAVKGIGYGSLISASSSWNLDSTYLIRRNSDTICFSQCLSLTKIIDIGALP